MEHNVIQCDCLETAQYNGFQLLKLDCGQEHGAKASSKPVHLPF